MVMLAKARRRRFGKVVRGHGNKEIDPICALQAAMEGYEVVTMEQAAPKAYLVTATSNRHVITDHMREMKDRRLYATLVILIMK